MILRKLKFKTVNSTNDIAISLIKKNKLSPSIIIADNQKKGRGTMGKQWISKNGNIFISIYFCFKSEKIKVEELSVLNSFIIKNILEKYSKHKLTIKWPNDILINKQKLCGTLQEIVSFKLKKYLIIGIGINTFNSPENKKFKATSLVLNSKYKFKNNEIIKKIKKSYELLISDIDKYKLSYLKKKIMNY
jgi:BirA family biotin operon repressor/biotin-[acetyl-CoA-carboxylase] ligase|tara:strand:+ start:845 stop:1414 length:570 start_codon:yes stop_codon:yes gene_type:complete